MVDGVTGGAGAPAPRAVGVRVMARFEHSNREYDGSAYGQPPMPGKGRRKAGWHRVEPDPLAAAVGARVRRLRREQSFSFDAFVEEVGLGRGYVSELERGLVVPGLGALATVAAALEVTVADLVVGVSGRVTPREDLYEITRDLPPVAVRRLLAEARRMAAELEEEDET